jgi:hypothetical protein
MYLIDSEVSRSRPRGRQLVTPRSRGLIQNAKGIESCQTENENDVMTGTELGVNGTHVIAPAAFNDDTG